MPSITPILLHPHTLDYTFMNITKLEDIIKLDESEEDSNNPSNLSLIENQNIRLKHSGITTLRMSYNRICDLASLHSCLSHLITDPSRLQWMDLSNNMICKIGCSLENFKHLSVLYMHANDIKSFNSIKPLSDLDKLSSLTLHGNPIEEHKFYRNFVIHLFPNLVKLDFSVLTKQDRENSRTWAAMFRNKLKDNDLKEEGLEKHGEIHA